ncbi:unnamed protein product, partial [Discosporangium mesarthrocarpum]
MTAQFAQNQQPQTSAEQPEPPQAKAQAGTPHPKEVSELADLLRRQQFPEGASQADQFSKRWPNHPLGWTVLGMCLTALGAFKEAEPALKRALPLAPNNAAVANCLGVVLKALGKAAEARSVLKQAL